MERLGEEAPRMQCSGEWRSSRCRSHGGNGWRAVVNGRGEAMDGTGGMRWWSCEQRRYNGEASDGLPLFSFVPLLSYFLSGSGGDNGDWWWAANRLLQVHNRV
ncbi:hypothetical protein SESBI_51078 [Sesbania bispinosa]|nr:hypothetical protein SESBI_51078 [Sesbania bispinosa]